MQLQRICLQREETLSACRSWLCIWPQSFYFPKKERAKKPWTLFLWKLWKLEQVWAQAAAGVLCADIPANTSLELNLWNHLLVVSTCPGGRGGRSKSSSPTTSSTAAWVRILNSRRWLSCVSRGFSLRFYEAGKLLCQFPRFRVVIDESPRSRSSSWPSEQKQHTSLAALPSAENPVFPQIHGINFSYLRSLSE